ncbi:long polar fimbrial protein LpfD [Serratia rubidaea]|uniref:Long polar fimbrial protein LpfD n=1 Tax=Serratia rubidaea TaxID=61652 RepID=A0A447QI66_SERRU|nr:long polar fimbrial protein LpfD [Serratia rubidaea]
MKLKSIFRKLSVASVLAVAGTYIPQALAAPMPGACERSIGGAQEYPFSFSTSFTEPDQNTAGKIIENAAGGEWDRPERYTVTCGCTNMREAYVTAIPLLKELDYTGGTDIEGTPLSYYVLNDFLSVASMVYVHGKIKKSLAVPFYSRDNENTGSPIPCNGAKNTFKSGSQGQINLRFRRPFVGVKVIPPTRLLEVYLSSTSGVSSPTPVSYVTMSGTVTVPQNCEISPQPVVINFGDIMSTDFKRKGEMPKNFTPHQRDLTLACRNISDGVKVSLSFQGEADPSDPSALKSTNKDIAVKIEDSSSNAVISPNNGRLPVMMNYMDQTGKTGINVYPINTSNEMPEVGVFNSTATIRVEIE